MANEPEIEVFFKTVARRSWNLFKEDPLLYLLVTVVTLILSTLTLGILAGPLLVGFVMIVGRGMHGEKSSVWDVFDGFKKFLTAFAVFLIVALGIAVGAMLLVVPGLLVAFLTMYVWQAIALKDASVPEAFSTSFRLIKTNPVNSLLLLLVLAFVNAVGGSFVLGTLLTVPLSVLSLTVAFDELSPKPPMRRPEPVEVVEPQIISTAPKNAAPPPGDRPTPL